MLPLLGFACPGGGQPQAFTNCNESNSLHGRTRHGVARDDLPWHAVSTASPTLPGSHSDAGISSRRESLFRLCAAFASCHPSFDRSIDRSPRVTTPGGRRAASPFSATWADIQWLKTITSLPVLVKVRCRTPPVFLVSTKAPECFDAFVCMTPKSCCQNHPETFSLGKDTVEA